MKRVILFYGAVMVLSSYLPIGATEFCSNTSPTWTDVMNGEYRVSNNVWGSGEGVGVQCLDIDLESSYFKLVSSTHNSSGVASYPFIYKGYHWGGYTNLDYNPFPIIVGEISTAPFTWIIDTTGVTGTWNAAFECWFSTSGKTAPDAAELMIWINYGGGAGPAGSRVATLDIGGYTWDVYFTVFTNWNYIAYKLVTPGVEVNVDLVDFIHDSLMRGYLLTTWYLDNMEAGFEIWRNGQGLTCESFTATAEGGAEPINYSPVSFGLLSPSNNRNLTSMIIPFKWQKSVDPNADPVEYLLHIFGTNVDTTISQIDTTEFTFDATNHLDSYTFYTWNVKATDGIDTTSSLTQRTFRTPNLTGLAVTGTSPNLFMLGQNYPNPFNPRTTISFSLPQPGSVTLKVYDARGCEVMTLADRRRETAGYHEIIFDATDLPSGVYLYRLQSDNLIATRKMMVIK
jgi:hypothetical protein